MSDPAKLPAVPDPGDVEPEEVVDGEIVEDEDTPAPVPVHRQVVQVVTVVVRPVVVAAQHPATRTVGRNGAYVWTGGTVVAKRLWDSRTTARYERMMRAAEASGDHATALEWEARLSAFRRDRHQRRMQLLELPGRLVEKGPKVGAGILALLAALGVLLAIASGNVREVARPVIILAHVVMWTGIVVSVAWGPLVLAAPWAVIAALWAVGRKAASLTPGWAQTAGEADLDIAIDETTIARALEALRIPQITSYLKEGLPLQYLVPCRVDGRGTHAVIRLPVGVTAEKIARRRPDLASGVYRLAKEVWPKTGDEAGILDLWIADKGALNEGAGPYPLLEGGFTDVFKGLPFGKTLRGDPAKIPVIGRNTLCGGAPEQGKSNAARVVAAGYTLDVITEIRVYVPDTNFDFERFKPRCARYVMGAEDEHLENILGDLEDLKDELQVRGQLLIDYEQEEVTRALAHAGVGLHPVFVLLEEAHVAIQHRKYGKDISALLCDIVKLDRKRGIHMMVSTQSPTKDSMPRDVTRCCTVGIAYSVGDHVPNDAILGQGAYRAGHRATELIPGTDRGTALCKGFVSEARSEMVQAHRVSGRSGDDQVTPLVDRAMAELERQGRAVPGTGRRREPERRDLLADLDEVLGSERVKLRDAVALLRRLAPMWLPYRMTATQLRADLEDRGVRVINSSGTPHLDPEDLRAVIAERVMRSADGQ